MTLSLAAVFIPVLFLGGVLGRLFKEFAVTICVAILISGVVSVTLTPMLCSRFLRSAHHAKHGFFYNMTEKFFQGMLRVYDVTLQMVLRHTVLMMARFVLVLVATGYMFVTIPKGFIPDRIPTNSTSSPKRSRAPRSTRWPSMRRRSPTSFRRPERGVVDGERRRHHGASNLGGPNYGELVIHLKPRAQRQRLSTTSSRNCARNWRRMPGVKSYLQNPPTIQIGGQVTKSLYQFSMQTPNKPVLYEDAEKLPRRWRNPRRGRCHHRRGRSPPRR